MSITKSLYLIIFDFLFYSSLQAQDTSSAIAGKIAFVNQNVSRGCYQAGASIQPEAVVSLANWEFSVWGTTDLSGSEKEIDLTATYRFRNFGIGITDYWCDAATAKYRNGHIPELNVEYGSSKIPLSFSFNTVLYGDDNCFSPYLEAVFAPEWKSGWQAEFTAGITPWENRMLNAKRFAATRLSAGLRKTLHQSGTVTVEAFTTLLYNPQADNAFWLVGFGVSF